MAKNIEAENPIRLEDVIALAKAGKKCSGTVTLKKQGIKQKVHPEETEERKDEMDSYLLIGDYSFDVDAEKFQVSKVYVIGFGEESLDTARANRNIANGRLKMDFQRLKDAHIKFETEYFS